MARYISSKPVAGNGCVDGECSEDYDDKKVHLKNVGWREISAWWMWFVVIFHDFEDALPPFLAIKRIIRNHKKSETRFIARNELWLLSFLLLAAKCVTSWKMFWKEELSMNLFLSSMEDNRVNVVAALAFLEPAPELKGKKSGGGKGVERKIPKP